MDKRTNNSYHDNTTINKKILTKMLFKIPKEIFPTEKYSFPIITFFFALQKRPIEVWTSASAIFIGVQGSLGWWRNKVARSDCLEAILVFLLKTTSFPSWPAEAIVMSLQPFQLEDVYSSSEEAEEETVDSGEEEVS